MWLALPFGWTGSPAYYGVLGNAISFLVRRESPASLILTNPDRQPFFSYVWVDDHVLIEPDTPGRLDACAWALRLAMMAVLVPRSINEKKFTSWETHLTALGLEWDTVAMTVSMPQEKIDKAIDQLRAMRERGSATQNALEKLLGSLRHVFMCVRAAKPFFQRLMTLYRHAPRLGFIKLTMGAQLDLAWFEAILQLGQLRSVPLTLFSVLPVPTVQLYMDASNDGLCVLYEDRREFIRLQFDAEEKGMIRQGNFSINVREQLSVAFAVLMWGAGWSNGENADYTHVRVWIDNKSAVAWSNRLQSKNEFSQELNRIIGVAEAIHSFRLSAEHISGSQNVMADLGSRAWSNVSMLTKWRSLTSAWTQVCIPARFRKIYTGDSSPFKFEHLPTHPDASISARGRSGANSVLRSNGPAGYQRNQYMISLRSWFSLRSPHGAPIAMETSSPSDPSKQRSVTSDGSTLSSPVLLHSLRLVTRPPSQECDGSVQYHDQKHQLRRLCSRGSVNNSTSTNPSTASFWGLRCWDFFLLRSAEFEL